MIDCTTLEDDEISREETSKQLGINYRSILFELEYLDVDMLLPDVMHDLLESTLQCEAKFVLRHALVEKYISYTSFSKNLNGLELEADNRPSEMSSATLHSNDRHLGQKGIDVEVKLYAHAKCCLILYIQLLRCGC